MEDKNGIFLKEEMEEKIERKNARKILEKH